MSENPAPLPTYPGPEATPKASGWHPVNVGHLVMGVAFLGLAMVLSLIATDVVNDEGVRWLLPLPWVAAGLAGLIASLLPSRRRRHETRQTGWVGTATAEATADAETDADATAEPEAEPDDEPDDEPGGEPGDEPATETDENPTDENTEETR